MKQGQSRGSVGTTSQGKGKGCREVRIGQALNNQQGPGVPIVGYPSFVSAHLACCTNDGENGAMKCQLRSTDKDIIVRKKPAVHTVVFLVRRWVLVTGSSTHEQTRPRRQKTKEVANQFLNLHAP